MSTRNSDEISTLGLFLVVLGCMGIVLILGAIVHVIAVNHDKNSSAPTEVIHRSDVEMKAFEKKLLAMQKGDLLVVFPYEGEQFPKLLQVNTLQQHDGIAVSYVADHDTNPPGAFPLNSVSSFLNIHRNIGFVHIVPRERVNAFYRSIELTAADLSQ